MYQCRGCKGLMMPQVRLCEDCELRESFIMQECAKQHMSLTKNGHLTGHSWIKLPSEDVDFLEDLYLIRGFKALRVYGHWIGHKEEDNE